MVTMRICPKILKARGQFLQQCDQRLKIKMAHTTQMCMHISPSCSKFQFTVIKILFLIKNSVKLLPKLSTHATSTIKIVLHSNRYASVVI